MGLYFALNFGNIKNNLNQQKALKITFPISLHLYPSRTKWTSTTNKIPNITCSVSNPANRFLAYPYPLWFLPVG